jgi:hypothetical protein
MSNEQPVPPATEQPKIDDGGQAFPHCYFIDITGMSLRDYFAAAAMHGLVESEGDSWITEQAATNQLAVARCQSIATASYWLADAMLAARKSGGAA